MMLTRIPTRRIVTRTLHATTRCRCTPSAAAPARHYSSSFAAGARPGPPRLPAKEQAEFERLQRAAAVSSAFQPGSSSSPTNTAETTTSTVAAGGTTTTTTTTQEEATDSSSSAAANSELSEGGGGGGGGGLYRGAKPEFEGDRNPRTGEVGGPKNEPLRWGSGGDWSYNGKVTDF